MIKTHKCRKCGAELTIDENWSHALKKKHDYICDKCNNDRVCKWQRDNPEKARKKNLISQHKYGTLPMDKNKDCSLYLGVVIAEGVLAEVFDNVKRMPNNNRGFDVVCGNGYRIDIKSGCRCNRGGNGSDHWQFSIKQNRIADHFLLLAFDNRENLNPEHIWLIPGCALNGQMGASIAESRLSKWNEYELNIDRVSQCCDTLRGGI